VYCAESDYVYSFDRRSYFMPSNESPTDSIINEFDQPSAILNENLEIISANDSFCNSIQIEAADIVGLNILSIFSEGTVSKRISRKLKSLLKTGKRFSDSEVLCASATGEVKFLLSASLISGRDTSEKRLLVVLKKCNDDDFLASDEGRALHFESIFNAIEDPIFIISADRIIKDANLAALKLLNLKKCDVVGKKCSDLIHEGRIPDDCPLAKMFRDRETSRTVMELERLSAIFEVITFPIYDDDKIQRAVHYMKDITSQEKLKEELERKEKLYRLLYESAGEPIFTYDTDLRIIDVNRTALNLVGMEKGEVIGKNMFELGVLHPDDFERVKVYIERLFGGESHLETDDIRLKTKDGDYRIFNITANALYAGDKLVGVNNICHDVTATQILLEKIKESEEKYRAIVENSHSGILVVNENYRFEYVNDMLCRMLGRDRNEIIGHDFREFLSKESRELVADRYIRRQRGEEVPARYEFDIIRKDGERRTVEISTTVIKDSKDRVKTIAQLLDVTDKKRAEAEKEKLSAQLIHAQKMEAIGRLAGGVAHDFNNILNVIIGYAELIKEMVSDNEAVYEDVLEILRASELASALTEKLLAFTRSEVIKPRVINLNETIAESTQMLQRLVGEDIDLKFFPASKLWNVRLDPLQVEHILINLTTNARDAIRNAGVITIETSNVYLDGNYCKTFPDLKPGEYVVMIFSDNGAGIEPDVQKKIFEPFFTTKDYGEGTGLGLSIVYGIVNQNNGLINVYSEVGKGTTFKIYFPRFRGDTPEDDEGFKSESRNLGGTETILVIDDREQIVSICKRGLESFGYTVLTAMSPAEALDVARDYKGDIHLIITDVVLPEMNGRELAKKISSIKPETRVLYISGYTANAIAHRGILDPGINFLQKPFSPFELATKVREVLDSN